MLFHRALQCSWLSLEIVEFIRFPSGNKRKSSLLQVIRTIMTFSLCFFLDLASLRLFPVLISRTSDHSVDLVRNILWCFSIVWWSSPFLFTCATAAKSMKKTVGNSIPWDDSIKN